MFDQEQFNYFQEKGFHGQTSNISRFMDPARLQSHDLGFDISLAFLN